MGRVGEPDEVASTVSSRWVLECARGRDRVGGGTERRGGDERKGGGGVF